MLITPIPIVDRFYLSLMSCRAEFEIIINFAIVI